MEFLRVLQTNGTPCDVRIESIYGINADEHGDQCWTAILDISERRQTEKHLKESEERLLNVIQTLPVMIIAFDEHCQITLWNRECEQVTGYAAQKIIQNPDAWQCLLPDQIYRQQMLAALRQDLRSETLRNWEWEISCQDGSRKTIVWSVVSKHAPMPRMVRLGPWP